MMSLSSSVMLWWCWLTCTGVCGNPTPFSQMSSQLSSPHMSSTSSWANLETIRQSTPKINYRGNNTIFCLLAGFLNAWIPPTLRPRGNFYYVTKLRHIIEISSFHSFYVLPRNTANVSHSTDCSTFVKPKWPCHDSHCCFGWVRRKHLPVRFHKKRCIYGESFAERGGELGL